MEGDSMDKVTTVKSQVKLHHWAQLIEECQSSSLTVKEWCSSNNVSKDQYYYWLRKLRKHTVANIPTVIPNDMDVPKADVSFSKLQVNVPVYTSKATVTIHMADATVEISEGTSQQTIEAVLRALSQL